MITIANDGFCFHFCYEKIFVQASKVQAFAPQNIFPFSFRIRDFLTLRTITACIRCIILSLSVIPKSHKTITIQPVFTLQTFTTGYDCCVNERTNFFCKSLQCAPFIPARDYFEETKKGLSRQRRGGVVGVSSYGWKWQFFDTHAGCHILEILLTNTWKIRTQLCVSVQRWIQTYRRERVSFNNGVMVIWTTQSERITVDGFKLLTDLFLFIWFSSKSK